jgi:hypothetical protein
VIYFDSSALLKFVEREKESEALRRWRLPEGTELVTSELAGLEITRTFLWAGVDHQRVPYVTGQALRGLYVVDVREIVGISTGIPRRSRCPTEPHPPACPDRTFEDRKSGQWHVARVELARGVRIPMARRRRRGISTTRLVAVA